MLELLLKLNPNYATGPDLLPARILKDMAKEIAPILTSISNGVLIQRTGGPQTSRPSSKRPSSYRPVSLTRLCCKILEHIVTSNVLKHLDEHHILTDCRHGFMVRRSCEIQLLTLAQELIECLDKKHHHDLIIRDFSKGFDRVPHE